MISQSDIASAAVKEMPWQELGLAGVVIAALFWIVFHLIKSAAQERKETRDEHREERSEWRKEHSDRSEKMEAVVGKLTDAVRDLKHKG